MNSNHALWAGLALLLCGTLLVALRPNDAAGMMLLSAGMGAMGAGAAFKPQEKKMKREAADAKDEADDLRNQTAVLQRKLVQRPTDD